MLRGIGKIIVGALRLGGSLVWSTPALYLKRRKAIAIFKRELEAMGLDAKAVKEFTATYSELSELKVWLQSSSQEKS